MKEVGLVIMGLGMACGFIASMYHVNRENIEINRLCSAWSIAGIVFIIAGAILFI